MRKATTKAATIIIWTSKINDEVITSDSKSYFFQDKAGILYAMGDSPKMLKGMLTLIGRPDVAAALIKQNIF